MRGFHHDSAPMASLCLGAPCGRTNAFHFRILWCCKFDEMCGAGYSSSGISGDWRNRPRSNLMAASLVEECSHQEGDRLPLRHPRPNCECHEVGNNVEQIGEGWLVRFICAPQIQTRKTLQISGLKSAPISSIRIAIDSLLQSPGVWLMPSQFVIRFGLRPKKGEIAGFYKKDTSEEFMVSLPIMIPSNIRRFLCFSMWKSEGGGPCLIVFKCVDRPCQGIR